MDLEHALTHGPFLSSIARALVGDEHAADDALQDTWLRTLQAAPGDVRHPRGWLRTVVTNFARRRGRSEGRRRAREERAARPEALDSAAEVVEQESLRREVLGAVLELNEPYRTTILLRFYDDLPPREVASQQGIPVATVRTRTRRGLEQLRERLDGRYGDRDAWSRLLIPVAAPIGRGGLGGPGAGPGAVLATAGKLGAALATVVLAGLALVWMIDERPVAGDPVGPVVSSPDDGGLALGNAPRGTNTRALAESSDASRPVAGRVISRADAPIGHALVQVLAPSAGVEPAFVWTGDDGLFRFECDAGIESVRLALTEVASYWVLPGEVERTAAPGDESVEFTVDAAPTATVELHAVEVPFGRPLHAFEASLWRVDTRNYFPASGTGGVARVEVPLNPALARTAFRARLADGEGQGRTVELRPGELRKVVLEVPREDLWVEVVDPDGAPVEDALVFFGGAVELRGDEPLKPSKPERIKNGARTDAQGLCALRGGGRTVSAYHPEHSTVTVPLAESARIQLPRRAEIAGRVIDATGAPLPEVEVTLDQLRTARTDADGRFHFAGVEQGVRGLQVSGSAVWAYFVRARAGETVRVELGAWFDPTRVAADSAAPGQAVLVSLADFGVLTVVELGDAPLQVAGLGPGEYLLASRGLVSCATLADGALEFEAGSAALTVRADPGQRVYVAPAGAHALADLMCQRVGGRKVPASGEVRFEQLAAGTWVAGFDRIGPLAEIALAAGAEAEVELE